MRPEELANQEKLARIEPDRLNESEGVASWPLFRRPHLAGFQVSTEAPTSSSWLNLVERWFATLTDRCIRRGVHRSTRELEAAIKEYLAVNNEEPKPLVWTKTADAILRSVANYCRRTSRTGH